MESLDCSFSWLKFRSSGTVLRIFDQVRKRYVHFTPEEWVRQCYVRYLNHRLFYPRALIKLEQLVQCKHLHYRPDIVVYNRLAEPLLLVECKAPDVSLNSGVWQQIARYNVHFKAQMLAVTNGIKHFCWRIDHKNGDHKPLRGLPPFGESMQVFSQDPDLPDLL